MNASPSDRVRLALQDLPEGWFHHGAPLLALFEQHRPAVVVELGSWRGASAIGIARLVRDWGGTVTCVDTWGDDDAIHGGLRADGPRPRPLGLGTCAAHLVEAGVAASVRLIVASTIEAAALWRGPIDALWVDADHDYAAVLADLEAWVPHVRPGGLIAGDDYGNPMFPGVRMAWNYFEHAHGLTLTRALSPGAPGGMPLIYGTV